jgi:hypothetical protein
MSEPRAAGVGVVVSAWAVGPPVRAGVEQAMSEVALEALMTELRAQGAGYVEVARGGAYPAITIGFRGDQAVVSSFASVEAVALLRGDGSLPSDTEVEVPAYAEDAVYTGGFVSTVDVAWAAVRRFVGTGDLAAAGEWVAL